MPCFSTALAFYDGYRSKTLPANLIQVFLIFYFKLINNFLTEIKIKTQRDYFGAHTYYLLDGSGPHHTNWTGRGGNVSASTYNV
jgi:6-phosphogluconate dehydrogenase